MTAFALPFFLENARDIELIGLVIGLYFWIQIIRYCATHETDSLEKFLWLALIVATPPVGPLIYFFVRVTRLRG